MRLDRLVVVLLAASAAHAQLADLDPDWREADAPPPPPVQTTGLIALEIPRSSLRFGVDPASVSIGKDGIVRYMVVAISPTGVVNAMYEGIRCTAGVYRVYARYNADSGWTRTQELEWRPLHDPPQSQHSLAVARNGACIGRGPNRSATQIVRDLRAPADTRFNLN